MLYLFMGLSEGPVYKTDISECALNRLSRISALPDENPLYTPDILVTQ